MEMKIRFPGNKKVSAEFKGLTVMTDQPKEAGGDGSAPAPFDLFLASIGTCAGIFVLSFCRKRDIPTEGLEITQRAEWNDAEHRVFKITLEITLPNKAKAPAFAEAFGSSTSAALRDHQAPLVLV